ncbi:N-6 DNA methylase [Synechococcus sp. PCC 6312]|uniref:N-6 DNA methylase n=1 Tax=Synechococcus sp. (strain ATCC 27167 / PCC 6312) TaxID=195253 RepID=UPI00029EC868|nr:N-6 DNA methylase [Synechococcus sp. PCC 6312]AFY60436.1 type I restriction-modification system methyltransferase subunit [Synechococcus sp. PCC 6312]
MKLANILKDSNYKLLQFTTAEIEQLEQSIILKEAKSGEAPYTDCLVRKKQIKLTPEEVIRQLYLRVLTERLNYPLSRIQVEYGVNFGTEVKRADIVVMDKDRPNAVYMIVELKKPKLKDGKGQLRSYCNATGAQIAVWTNGAQISYYQRKDPNYFEDIPKLPNANETLADILKIKFTLEDLIANDKLVKENKSLKTLIEEMEDEVLANAGVDVFEELFKLIFTKLYDEWFAGQGNRRSSHSLEFRNTGQTESDLYTKIQSLFDKAKKKWEGVFSEDTKISLTRSHLSVCVSSLENVKLFNSNLEVIDEAFEYLINKSSRGEKGQFFTPRYVIDMCVRMLNPQEDEYIIDTAAGSSGFPVHTIFYVWRQILDDEGLEASHLFSLEDKPPRCKEYVEDKVFAIDFDEKAVRVARTLNLIAGDGQTNVLHLNTLDYELWDEVTEQENWDDVYHEGFRRLKKRRPKGSKDYREFQFDVLMANPPFAGDIKEPRMIARYDLAKKANGKWETKVGRDILFIERNLDFLKPGGRMAIVLPQGRFNNSSDKNIRDYIAARCRILAVVGLHSNTFKPHTGTKTSVLFVQKWNDDPKAGALCPRKDDYNIFFATMRKSGKDNSGEKIYVKKPDGSGDLRFDEHNHWIVDHDLFNHEGLTEDGIAEAFIEFAKKENLSFFEPGPSVTPFDAVRYQQLMDGLEAVELKFSDVLEDNELLRIDSEYFKIEYLEKLRQIKRLPYQKIEEFAYVTDGIHESIQFDEDSSINLISAKSPKENIFDLSGNECISHEQHKKNPRTTLKEGDVIISTVGTIGNCAVVDETILPANSDRHVGIVRIEKDYKSYFLSTFILSKYGKFQTLRESTGNVQLNLFIYKIKSLKIPLLSEKFQETVEGLVHFAHASLRQSKKIYQQAENLLLSELGLQAWQPTEKTVAVKSFSESFLSSGRFDAEYYQPKYDELYDHLETSCSEKGWELKRLEDLSSLFKYGTSEPFEYLDQGLPFLRIADLQKYRFSEKDLKFISQEAAKQQQANVKTGDVLISRSGTLGLAVVIPEYLNNAVYGSYFILTRPDKTSILPTYLALYINSLVGKLQTEQANTGGIQTNLTIPVLESLLIACPPLEVQQKFVHKVTQSYDTEDKSKQLLEIAKTGVERAIETDEATAKNWINQQLEVLGIELT